MVKNPSAMRQTWFYSWGGKIFCRKAWKPTPVFLLGEFRGQRSLAGYRPWGHKEMDTTEQLSTHSSTYFENGKLNVTTKKGDFQVRPVKSLITVHSQQRFILHLMSYVPCIFTAWPYFKTLDSSSLLMRDRSCVCPWKHRHMMAPNGWHSKQIFIWVLYFTILNFTIIFRNSKTQTHS